MSTVESPPRQTAASAERLRTTMAAVRLSISWFGVQKSLSSQQKAEAASAFGAESQYLSAGKKLVDTRHPAFRAVTNVRSRIVSLWRAMSLPYVEAGIRLIRRDQIDALDNQLIALRADLNEAALNLQNHYSEMMSAAQQQLGTLYNPADYPPCLEGLFQVEWDFPSLEAPDYLQRLNPVLYEQECARVAARFDETVGLAEQAFTNELSGLVAHLNERLSGEADGKQKVFRDSAITNLVDFFQRFRNLNIRSNEQLDELVSQAEQIVQGVQPQGLRENEILRQTVAHELAGVQSMLDQLLVDRPRRNILRQTAVDSEAA